MKEYFMNIAMAKVSTSAWEAFDLKLMRLGRDEVVYIGDEARDIDAAQKVGIPIISVTWGFNSSDVLSRHCLLYTSPSPRDS